MLLIPCPHCGPRNESEFQHGGALRAPRPEDTSTFDDEAWVDYLTVGPNPMGPVTEKWWHLRGCGSWFTLRRDTVTHEILGGGSDGG